MKNDAFLKRWKQITSNRDKVPVENGDLTFYMNSFNTTFIQTAHRTLKFSELTGLLPTAHSSPTYPHSCSKYPHVLDKR
jgi:hypothetical protein